ncbi:DNA topoisomerase III [Edwardsiella ictaluri]|uniref:DNA topoisomerase n=1 Tax=Edwardsiella ictaluri (strain 93-146) TaxID=634503 RepID=C5BCW1_EDWI9|nr:DNA topoisomerase III [Edwardsiella ictaluri]ACR67567.1 DNA topoisomerase 3, putative [Edwardsiella ictaluri 93-146]AVZ81957.1 DNA topoisomerase III [Edwardsiella ictaluri]EKS7764699.1 DNA topoisomerase III [Edwardsiella ictaluri]EKS7771532.1 DNA topoisomerase III [Edwardsiella ictaluri]EKS7774709.1 DNA topoisomerase III [Edwardsiella ictaluri]
MQLYLCEKPSQAKDIARVLGISKRGQGFISADNITVTWAIGHLLEQASPDAYGEQFGKPWRVDVLPVLPDNWKMVVKPQTRDQFTVISKLLKQAGEVIIATDADREGEVIARELLAYCGYRGAVRRLWLSALDEASIREALAGILPGENTAKLYDAGLGRSRADWLIGMNLTRLYTLIARESGVSDVLSVGRVQTPTLAIVVNRDKEIADFVPVPWWQVQVLLEKDGVRFRATWQAAAQYCDDEKRCVNKQAANAVGQLCQQQKGATVLEVSQKRDKTPAPLCFDLGTLQLVCSRKFGMGAKETLAVAQSLYETHKATTYPRTDCGYLPTSMQKEIPEVMGSVAKSDPSVAPVLAQLDRGFVSRVWNDKKITAHHAIIPTRQAFDLSRLSADELKVYQLIRQHYFAQFLPLQESDVTDASFNIGGQLFLAKGKVNVITGWTCLFQKEIQEDPPEDDDMALPALNKGDSCIVNGASVGDKVTSPPKPFTEGTLIAAMKNAASFVSDPKLKKVLRDNAGLGTEATRAGVLETLFSRHYLEKKGKHIHATLLARELIAALPETLTSPGMTALWEQALDDIAQGKMSLDTFIQKQLQWTRHLVDKGRADTVKITAPVTPPCPVCKGLTRKRKGKNGDFWGCIRYPECNGIVAGKSGGKGRKIARGKKTVVNTEVELSASQ